MIPAERAYRRLLNLLPEGFRLRNEEALAEAFRLSLLEFRPRGLGWIPFWIGHLRDLAMEGLRRRNYSPSGRKNLVMESVLQDLRNGLRGFRRRPTLVVLSVLSLGLGIAAATTVFSVVNAVLVEPLPYSDPEEIVAVFESPVDGEATRSPTAPMQFVRMQGLEGLSHLTAAHAWTTVITGDRAAIRVPSLKATARLFELLGVPPAIGRGFNPDDAGRNVAIISHGLWSSRFGEDPDIVGSTTLLDGESFEIVGVMPPGFRFPPFWASSAELWASLEIDPANAPTNSHFLRIFARLDPGTTLEQLRARMETLSAGLREEFPASYHDRRLRVEPLSEPVVADSRPALLILLASVGLLLLIACANVANLLLAHSAARSREMAVRAALGASRWRIARQWLVESLALAGLAGAAGIALTPILIGAVTAIGADFIPVTARVELNLEVLAVGVGLALLTGILFGTAPAFGSSRPDLAPALRDGDRAATGGSRALRSILVTAEVILAILLVAGTGLLARTFLALNSFDPGFRTSDVLTMTLALGASPNAEGERRLRLLGEVRREALALPGVHSVGFVNHIPVGSDLWGNSYAVRDKPAPEPGESPGTSFRVADEGYADAVGLRVLQGRWISATDGVESDAVVVVNQAFADREWPGESPIGKYVKLGGYNSSRPWRRVIGLFEDTQQFRLTQDVGPEVYVPYTQDPTPWNTDVTLAAHTGEDAAVVSSLRRRLAELDPMVPLTNVRTIEAVLAEQTARERLNLVMMGGFGTLALVLAAVGLYGVMSQLAARRTREVGIRIALGATPADITRMVLGGGLRLALPGLVIGVAAALAMGRLISSQLWGVSPTDPLTLVSVAAIMLAVALLASLVPGRRAAAVQPVEALRVE